MIPPGALHAVPPFVAMALMAALVRVAWRSSTDRVAIPFGVLAAGASVWAFTDMLQLVIGTPSISIVIEYANFVGAVIVPGAWFLFALTYAKNASPTNPRLIGLLSIEPLLTLILAATDSRHNLIYTTTDPVMVDGITLIQTTSGAWYWMNLAYSYILVIAGIGLLVHVAVKGDRLYRRQAGFLVAGAVVPLGANIFHTFMRTDAVAIDYTSVTFAATAALFGAALYRFDLLQLEPVARDIVIEELSDPIVVLNRQNRVVDANAAAKRLFDGLETGAASEQFLPGPPGELADSEFTATVDERTRTYVVRQRPLYGRPDDQAGAVLLFSDVTEVAEREQRLDVLNRMLRHNVRTDANVILGYLNLFSESHPNDIHIDNAIDRVEQLVARSEKAREITETLDAATHEATSVPLLRVVETVVDDCSSRFPDAEIDVNVADVDVRIAEERLLETAIENLVDNALEHTDTTNPWARITTETTGNHVTLRVEDSGPGLPSAERATLSAERETALKHSSGLGLWVVRWIASATGTRLDFAERDPRGTIVTLTFERAS